MKPENLVEHSVSSEKCSTGCPILDRTLGGGIPCNSVTEIVSESGCGKTQLCLQLLLSCQLPLSQGGLASSSLYLHSEFPFPIRRLHQLSQPNLYPNPNPLDNILIRPLHSADHLLDLLTSIDLLLANSPTQLPIKLIVIDSIAALFRSEFDNTPFDLNRRASLFFKISSKLKTQAKRFGLAVVVTNQVVDLVGSNGLRVGNLDCFYSSGRPVCPALGLSWANCVNSRLFLSRNEEIVGEHTGSVDFVTTQTKRHLHVVFAPHLPYSSCQFVILREGVFGVDS